MSPVGAVIRLDYRLLRRQSFTFAGLLAVFALATAAGFKAAFKSAAERELLAHQLASNPGFQALYGVGRRLDTVAGFTAWRFGGNAAVIAGVWALLAVTRILKGEEESGRADLVLAGALTRTAWMVAALGVLGALFGVLFL